MNDAYEIIVRAVGNDGGYQNELMKPQAEAMLEWRMSDDNGVLPSGDERREIQAGLMQMFNARYHANPYRVSIAILATTPGRRPFASWTVYRYGTDLPSEGESNGKD